MVFQIIGTIADISVVIGLVVAVRQLILNRKTVKEDFDRRKREATIPFTNEIISYTNEIVKDIRSTFGRDKVNTTDLRYTEDSVIQGKIVDYLNHMERLAVGINADVYDFDVFRRICGTKTLRVWDDLKDVVEERRRLFGSHAYTEFEMLSERI